ncbi:hypothetical protein K5549_010185 [Capra hircus]|nr:hypothetical protein K5549_010185 [Capra hircus]
MAGSGKLMAVMGGKDTVTGFLLGGIGVLNKHCQPNFLVMEKDTTISETEDTFQQFLNKDDISSILINQHALDALWHCIPAILEIPSKEYLCDAANVSIPHRARGMFMSENLH